VTRESEDLLPSLKALESLTFHLTLAERRVSSIRWYIEGRLTSVHFQDGDAHGKDHERGDQVEDTFHGFNLDEGME